MNGLTENQMKIKKIHGLSSKDLPAFIKAGNLDTVFGFCSIRMMYDEIENYEQLERKLWSNLEKNSHLIHLEQTLELLMRGEDVRRKILRLDCENIPNKGVCELLKVMKAINHIEEEERQNDLFKNHNLNNVNKICFKKVSLDFDQSEIILEIDPSVRYSNSNLYEKLMNVILTHQYIVEHYPNIDYLNSEPNGDHGLYAVR